MSVISRLVREPLVHFVLIGAAVFAAYAVFGDGDDTETRDRIVVTEGRLQQLAQIFAKTWQRPPTPRELRGLVDAYIKEEVYYREAVKLGLDQDDTLVRRRMQQKMEFLSEPDEAVLGADDAALQTYLDDNEEAYRVDSRVAFEQVFIKPGPSRVEADARAHEVRAALKEGGDPGQLGDPTLLPKTMPLSALRTIRRDFGDAFADAVSDVRVGQWTGPIRSPFGWHLVRVTDRSEGYDPKLTDVRDAVLRDWRDLKRQEHQAEAYDRLRANYEVVFPAPASKPKSDPETPRPNAGNAE